MQRFVIHLINGGLLVLILIGIPAITGRNFAWWRLSHTPTSQMLTLWGLGLAGAANFLGAVFLARGAKARILCWCWLAAFAAIVLVESLYFNRHINFDWLKQFLQRLK